MDYEKYMKIAIEEAQKGCGWTNPNPMVGAVIVKDGHIISKGYHKKYGDLHAERNAINDCKENLEGATLYVTLEPCCHYGKTPPCTDVIIQNKIGTVVIGSNDPNPLVAGKGIEILRQHGITVITEVLQEECDNINQVFFHYIVTKTPYVVMKYAMTADGKIATYTGASKWITGEKARQHVHEARHRYAAIMVGVQTVIADDPMLNCRRMNLLNKNEGLISNNPIRIICDTNLRTPLNSKCIKTADNIETIIATSCDDEIKQKPYIESGCKIIYVEKQGEHINLNQLMQKLGEMKIDSILLEGGADLNYSALQAGIVNKIHAYIGPKIFGGKESKSPVGGIGVEVPYSAILLKNRKITLFDEDILIEWEVENNVYRDC